MIRHTNSFIISLLLHTLLVATLFISYEYISPSFCEKKEEKKVCMNLSCMMKHEQVEKKVIQKPKPIVKKTIKKSKPKKIEKKVVPAKKRVYVKEAPKEVVVEEEIVELVEVVQTPAKEAEKSHVVVTPTKSEIVMQETKSVSSEQKYVDENLAKIAKLLQENLYYPRRARKRGVEGEVVVKFELRVNAEVSNIKIISSNSDVLSRGAIKTIEDLSFKFPKPKENLTLSVPIVYKLK